jgi:hypothetical protein
LYNDTEEIKFLNRFDLNTDQYHGFLVSSRISFVLLSKSKRDFDGLEGSDGGHAVVVAVVLNDDVRLGGRNDASHHHANL